MSCQQPLLSVLDSLAGKSSTMNFPIVYASQEFLTGPDKIDLLGRGSYALVRRCQHEKLKTVVVKYFLLNGSTVDIKKKIENAAKEALILTNLRHENIVRVFGITSWKNFCGVIMEEISGGTLEGLLFYKPEIVIPWHLRWQFFYELADALKYLHNQVKPHVHGDLKPQNILLTDTYTLKLADFGSVAIIQATGMSSSFRIPSNKQYTPIYSAPELLESLNKRACSCDMYSYALIGYEIITRHRVFSDARASISLLLDSIRTKGLKPKKCYFDDVEISLTADSKNFEIFCLLKNIVEQTWDTDPQKRLKSSEVISYLETFKESKSIDDFSINYRFGILNQTQKVINSESFKKYPLSDYTSPSELSLSLNFDSINLSEVKNSCANKLALSPSQIIEYLSTHLGICYKVLSNFKPYGSSQEVTLKNNGNVPILSGNAINWSIYFTNFQLLEEKHMKSSSRRLLPNCNFELIHVDATLYQLRPTSKFKGLQPHKEVKIHFRSSEIISRYDVLPRWYVCAPGEEPKVILCTDDDDLKFVSDFVSAEQWKRSSDDPSNPYSTPERYKKHITSDYGGAPLRIVPSPVSVQMNKNEYISVRPEKWSIFCLSEKLSHELSLLSNYFKINQIFSYGNCPTFNVITVEQRKVGDVRDCNEAHQITVDPDHNTINIVAPSRSGIFYAVQSLISIARWNSVEEYLQIPTGIIKDAPRFDYRGLLVDVARNFIKIDDIILIIKTMAMYKLNKLVLHLSDNEGWRIEIKGLPELTEIGGRRRHFETENYSLYPAFGSGPHDNTSGSGFYSIIDYRKILEVSVSHQIEVIPNIDMPGQCHAAIVAMTSRYNRLMKLGKVQEAEKFLITDLSNKCHATSLYHYKDSIINPFLKSTYSFIDHVIGCITELHKDIQPLTHILLSGDSIANNAWKETLPSYKTSSDFKNYDCSIQEYFVHKLSKLCSEKYGLKLSLFGYGVLNSTKEPFDKDIFNHSDAIVYAINPRFVTRYADLTHKIANAGYKVVISHCKFLFFDHPYEPDPEEIGLSWAAHCSDDKTIFSFSPKNLHRNENSHEDNRYINSKLGASKDNLEILRKPENVVGMQANLWTELLRNSKMIHNQLFPRLLAFAERAWHQAEWESIPSKNINKEMEKDWEEFANAVGYKEIPRLKDKGILYRIPLPGVTNNGNHFKLCSLYPGLKIFCRQVIDDERTPWRECKDNDIIPDVDGEYEFVTYDGFRKSRVVKFGANEFDTSNTNPYHSNKMRNFDSFHTY